jgi:hypothetical protein
MNSRSNARFTKAFFLQPALICMGDGANIKQWARLSNNCQQWQIIP